MEIVKSIRLVRRALSLSSGFSARTILYECKGYFEWEWRIILSIKPKCNDWISVHCTFSVRNAHAQYSSFQERETSKLQRAHLTCDVIRNWFRLCFSKIWILVADWSMPEPAMVTWHVSYKIKTLQDVQNKKNPDVCCLLIDWLIEESRITPIQNNLYVLR